MHLKLSLATILLCTSTLALSLLFIFEIVLTPSFPLSGTDLHLKMKLEVYGSVSTWLKVKNSYNIRRLVHSSATAGATQLQNEVRGAWQCQSIVKSYQ